MFIRRLLRTTSAAPMAADVASPARALRPAVTKGLLRLVKIGALCAVTVAGVATYDCHKASAATIDLGFAIDGSQSIGQTNFNTMTSAFSNALGVIPVGGANTYRVSVVEFSEFATTLVTRTINTAADLTAVQDAVSNAPYLSQSTCLSCGVDQLTTNFEGLGGLGDLSLMNIVTDGLPYPLHGQTLAEYGTTLQNTLDAAGWDGVSAEAIGSFDLTALEALAFPGTPDVTGDYTSLPDAATQAFILTLPDYNAYAAAIDSKVQNLVDNTSVTPLPATLPLFVTGLGAMGLVGRRRKRRAGVATA